MPADVSQAGAACAMGVRLAVAAILAVSAWQALRDPAGHEAAVAGYRLLPEGAVAPAARILPLFCAAAAGALAVPLVTLAGTVLAAGLLALFTGAIAINLRRGRTDIDCGCGGAIGQRISGGLIVRNVTLLVLLTVAAFETGPSVWPDAALSLAVAAAGTALYFAASQLLANQAAMRAAGVAA